MVGVGGGRKALHEIEYHLAELLGCPRILLLDLRLIRKKVFGAVGISVRTDHGEREQNLNHATTQEMLN